MKQTNSQRGDIAASRTRTLSRKKSILIGIAIIAVGIVGLQLMMATKSPPPKKAAQDSSPLVDVLLPQSESIQFEVKAHGVVRPRTETSLVSEVSGVVLNVSDRFVSGGLFAKDEIILQIDPTDYQVGVEQAKARLASEKAKFAQEKAKAEQAKKEWDLTGRSRKNAPLLALREPFLLEAEANVLSAEADLKKAEQKLARTIIRAPYDGMVKTKSVDVGQYVAVGTQLGVTFSTEYAEVRLPLTDQELAFIEAPAWDSALSHSKAPRVTLSANYAGELRRWQGTIVRMEGVVDEQSRVHYAVARINDPYRLQSQTAESAPLKVGTFVTALISGKTEENLVKLPRDVFRDLSKVLVSDKENQLYLRDLSVVRSEADFVYVRAGLQQGDRIVLTSIESPVQGTKVRIEGEQAEPEMEQEPAPEKEQQSDKEAYAEKTE